MTCLQELMSLWSDMAQLLNEEHLDPTYYSVFRGLVEDWTARSTRANLLSILKLVSSELHRLSNSVALVTGNSMAIIWETVRPSIPSNLDQWNAYDRLRGLTREFDDMVEGQIGKSEVVQRLTLENIEDVLTTKMSFLRTLEAVLRATVVVEVPSQVSFKSLLLIISCLILVWVTLDQPTVSQTLVPSRVLFNLCVMWWNFNFRPQAVGQKASENCSCGYLI
jgi:hypothetical protein